MVEHLRARWYCSQQSVAAEEYDPVGECQSAWYRFPQLGEQFAAAVAEQDVKPRRDCRSIYT
jgi:hypothetical protein